MDRWLSDLHKDSEEFLDVHDEYKPFYPEWVSWHGTCYYEWEEGHSEKAGRSQCPDEKKTRYAN
jgi:hypothetical protein